MRHIDLIRLIILPDPRKRSLREPIYDARADPDNFELLRRMIAQGFLRGDGSCEIPRIDGTTWKALDLYNATRMENICVRLSFRIGASTDIDTIHKEAVEIHSAHHTQRNRW